MLSAIVIGNGTPAVYFIVTEDEDKQCLRVTSLASMTVKREGSLPRRVYSLKLDMGTIAEERDVEVFLIYKKKNPLCSKAVHLWLRESQGRQQGGCCLQALRVSFADTRSPWQFDHVLQTANGKREQSCPLTHQPPKHQLRKRVGEKKGARVRF